MSRHVISHAGITIGCDPEAFFTKNGQVIGAEKVIPKDGLVAKYGTKIVLDGVQLEIHPPAGGCRQAMASYIKEAMITIQQHLATLPEKGIRLSFEPHVEVSNEELDTLAPESKILGCMPSENFYGFTPLGVDPITFRKRSAGGHVHMGLADPLMKVRERIVPILDIWVGNFCVMVDRDPYAAERRKVYGRAGEYRLPAHGLEYRTLSNFWLRSYPLMSMVFGLAKQACGIVYHSELARSGHYKQMDPPNRAQFDWSPEEELLKCVDLARVQRAINTNDLQLAKSNWNAIVEGFMPKVQSQNVGLNDTSLQNIQFFLQMIEEKGLNFWFPMDPLEHWMGLMTSGGHAGPGSVPFTGWENFLIHNVNTARIAAQSNRPIITGIAS